MLFSQVNNFPFPRGWVFYALFIFRVCTVRGRKDPYLFLSPGGPGPAEIKATTRGRWINFLMQATKGSQKGKNQQKHDLADLLRSSFASLA